MVINNFFAECLDFVLTTQKMHKQSKWHEAQPSASDEASALLLLSNLGRKHILMAQIKAEGPNF